jgi:5-methylcytosine-specific restriction endonuclease McrA
VHGRAVRRKAYDQARGGRVYASQAWRLQIRPAVLARDPVCAWGSVPRDEAAPESCSAASTDVAHITPREQGGSDEFDNLRGLCHRHHSAETSKGESWNQDRGGG